MYLNSQMILSQLSVLSPDISYSKMKKSAYIFTDFKYINVLCILQS